VFVITHLPQIACRADAHFAVSKTVADDRTTIAITPLSADAREKELARMLGGESKTALAHARELAANARGKKKE